MSEAINRCAICQEPLRVGQVAEWIESPQSVRADVEHVRKPGAKMPRRERSGWPNASVASGEPICVQCAARAADSAEAAPALITRHDATPVASRQGRRLADLVAIARPDHWFKNVFVLPGAFVAWTMDPAAGGEGLFLRLLLGLGAVCLVASSNYVINEILDAPFDRHHPTKRDRPLAAGRVGPAIAYILWLVLMVIGLGLGVVVSPQFGATLLALWIMGCAYNIPPIRTKDIPYLDVLSEAINNPIRMLAGWYIVSHAFPPASLLLAYWMVGCYFMAVKRLAELREIADSRRATYYRRSFSYYTANRLLVSIMFYASAAMLCFGAFLMRYKFELILSFPLVALVMAVYLRLGLQPNSPAQYPEKLYREPLLMTSVVSCAVLMIGLFVVDIPGLRALFAPSAPPARFWRLELGALSE